MDAAVYTMRTARRRFRSGRSTTARGLSFRAWARRTYNAPACAGKLLNIVMVGDPRLWPRGA